jgi:hypothetical protein
MNQGGFSMAREAHEHDPPVTAEAQLEAAEAQLESRLGDELKHLIEIVHFGHDMAVWAKTRVGAYFVNRAEEDLTEATRQLLDMNSLQDKKAADAHMKARVAVTVLRWINEAVTAGEEAELAIQGLDQAGDGHEG